jgi:hypothetical protein
VCPWFHGYHRSKVALVHLLLWKAWGSLSSGLGICLSSVQGMCVWGHLCVLGWGCLGSMSLIM